MCAVLPIFLLFFFQLPPERFDAVTIYVGFAWCLSTYKQLIDFKPDGLMAFD
jgi:hypothetical protein